MEEDEDGQKIEEEEEEEKLRMMAYLGQVVGLGIQYFVFIVRDFEGLGSLRYGVGFEFGFLIIVLKS